MYLSIEGMKEGVSSSVSHTAAAVSLTSSAVVITLTSECSLVDLAVLRTTKWHAVVLQLERGGGKREMERINNKEEWRKEREGERRERGKYKTVQMVTIIASL